MRNVVTAYWLMRANCLGRMFAGTTPKEVAECLARELEYEHSDDLPADERDPITIEAYETTQSEIDELPEFGGW